MTATITQREAALALANEARLYAAQLRRDLSTGRLMFCDVDLDDPMLRGTRVAHILSALPWKGPARKDHPYVRAHRSRKLERLLIDFEISDRTRVGSLSALRKRQLKQLVAERCPSQRESAG